MLRFVSGESGAAGGQGGPASRLRAVIRAKDEQIATLTASLEAAVSRLHAAAEDARAARERERRLELRVAELERRLSMDSSDSGTPSSKERIGAKEARKARQQSERERSRDRKQGGQPGHKGRARNGTRIRRRRRRRPRRRNAVPATGPWTGRRQWTRGGRRSLTWRFSGR
jgi:chromosome segregation ATPase